MRKLQTFMWWLSIANLIAVLYLGWLLFHPIQLPIIYNEPFPVDKEVVAKGEAITYTMIIKKVKPYPVDNHKNIICEDGNLVTLAGNQTNLPLGDHVITPEVIIPHKTSLGTCYIEIVNEYQINGLRTETVRMVTRTFEVIEHEHP